MTITYEISESLDRSYLRFCEKFGFPLELRRPTQRVAVEPPALPIVKASKPEPIRQLSLVFAD